MQDQLQYILDNTSKTTIKKLDCGSYELAMEYDGDTLVESMPGLPDAVFYSYRFLKNEMERKNGSK